MRQFVLSVVMVSLMSGATNLFAQGPFGPFGRIGPAMGPAFGPPGFGMRPPMPPIPVPGVYRPAPSYVRVPGVTLVRPTYVVPVYRSTTVVAVPVLVPSTYSTARVAVVQPITAPSTVNVYQAGNSTHLTPPARGSSSNDLRPGMVLPDGAVVVSVGQAGASSANSAPSAMRSQAPTAAPIASATNTPASSPASSPVSSAVPGPVVTPSETQSILEAEEIPRPSVSESSTGSTDKPATKQF